MLAIKNHCSLNEEIVGLFLSMFGQMGDYPPIPPPPSIVFDKLESESESEEDLGIEAESELPVNTVITSRGTS